MPEARRFKGANSNADRGQTSAPIDNRDDPTTLDEHFAQLRPALAEAGGDRSAL